MTLNFIDSDFVTQSTSGGFCPIQIQIQILGYRVTVCYKAVGLVIIPLPARYF